MAKKAAVKAQPTKYASSGKTLKRSVSKALPKGGQVHSAGTSYEKNHAPLARHKNAAPSGK